MKQQRRAFLGALTGVTGLGLAGVLSPVFGQTTAYPNKPLKWLVGSTAGSGMDILARVVSEAMSKDLGQAILVDNRAGAAGAIAANALTTLPADGYTILNVDMGTYSLNPNLYKKLGYDPARDLMMTGMMITMPQVLVVSSALNVNSLQEFIAYVKAQPAGSVNFASSGNGHPTHLTMELFQRQAGIRMTHVPYKGSTPAVADIATGGQLAAMFTDPNTPAPFVQAGKLKYLAVATPKRVPAIPNVMTLDEAGLGFNFPVWAGIAVLHGTPQPIVERLNASLNAAMSSPQVIKKLGEIGFLITERWTPRQTEDFAHADLQEAGKNLASLNIRLE